MKLLNLTYITFAFLFKVGSAALLVDLKRTRVYRECYYGYQIISSPKMFFLDFTQPMVVAGITLVQFKPREQPAFFLIFGFSTNMFVLLP